MRQARQGMGFTPRTGSLGFFVFPIPYMTESTLHYQVKLFANFKEHVGQENWTYESDQQLTSRQLLNIFFDQYPDLARLRVATRIAVNQVFCQEEVSLAPGDELALIPPVSGG